ncbi:MAG: serine hydrolase [Rhodospirillaceae bacterium]|jgi:CubicO group peptidase (beta-lactamase class C family)|nr:serine hydrolase [Rhodospirillaceae bacterium]MBT5239342.1 serine hydrolase [Rhodospirillaceae bacterium]MBT5566360.1 serine hydrolase [Rhodospirillaceae bacterium]MBT6088453.1 serine hydrolase [Rhodospirillaceae bacterium]MBT6960498.1 serine hydrolase [Rhodospirillaceae bacterium]
MRHVFRVTLAAALPVMAFLIATSPADIAGAQESAAEVDVDAKYPPEAKALYLSRLNAMFGGSGGQNGGLRYDTLEDVPGVETFAPLPGTDQGKASTISRDALDTTEAFAAARNSQAFMVWRKGKLEREAYFNGADANTLIVGRSLSKPVTVIAVGRAIMEGHIQSVDQPVSDFITEWKGTDRESMLIRHLLDMRTGFLRQGMERGPESILNRSYLHPYHADVIINEYPLTHEPGERYDYSNATSEMVAPLIERATGMRYGEWVSEQILKPLGAKGGQVWVNRPKGTAHSGCCILLPADTFLRLGMLSLFDGMWNGVRLLPEGYVAQTKIATPQNEWAGMGLYVAGRYIEYRGAANPDVANMQITKHAERYLAADLYLYDGNANQVVYIIPSEEMVILRVGNTPPKDNPWDNSFVPNTLMRSIIRAPGETPPTPQS